MLRTPAPAIAIKSVDEVVLEQRPSEDFDFLDCMDVKGAEELNPDAFDGCHDGEEFANLLNADIDIAFNPAETTVVPESHKLDEDGDSQCADFDQHEEGSQAAHLATQQAEDAEDQEDAETQEQEQEAGKSGTSDGLSSMMATTSVGDKFQVKCKVVAGDWVDDFDVEVARGTKFSDLHNNLDIGHEDIALLSDTDFTLVEDKNIASPQTNPERPEHIVKDNNGGDRVIHRHQMRGVVGNLADIRNTVIFCIKKGSLVELKRNQREAAPPSHAGATKAAGAADAPANRTASA